MRTRRNLSNSVPSYPVPDPTTSFAAQFKYEGRDLINMSVAELQREQGVCADAIRQTAPHTPRWYVERRNKIERVLRDSEQSRNYKSADTAEVSALL